MPNITIIIKHDEEILSSLTELLNNLKNIFNTLLENVQINNSHIINELFKNCASSILEEYIKSLIKNISDENLKRHFSFDTNKWYDFKYDNTQIKIIAFEKDNNYSSTKLTSSQYTHRKDMIYVSVVYSIENNLLTIDDILVTGSDDIRIKYDRVIYNSIIGSSNIDDNDNESDYNQSGNNEGGNNQNIEHDS